MDTRQQSNILRGLEIGDVVKCTNGHEYEFVRMKQTKFIGKRDGGTYDVPVSMFIEVVHKAVKERFDTSSLREGELLYILSGKQDVTVFRFKYMINAGKILAENPVTGTATRIPVSMVEGTVRQLEQPKASIN